jgi:chaperonin cofactor prefoldin
MINNYEIGGNEVKTDASEAIAAIPENRTMLVEQLTSDEPVNPEAAMGLSSIEQVFAHFKPQIDVEFTNEEGQSVEETFHFASVGDFSVKKMTQNSKFLKNLDTQKEFYDTLIKQLRSNKVLQRALENADSKAAFVAALQGVIAELDEAENV